MTLAQDAKKRGWPLTKNEIFMERVNWEDKVLHMGEPAAEIPKLEIPPVKSGVALLYNWVKSNVRTALNP